MFRKKVQVREFMETSESLNEAGKRGALVGEVLRKFILRISDSSDIMEKLRNSKGELEGLFRLKRREQDWQDASEEIEHRL